MKIKNTKIKLFYSNFCGYLLIFLVACGCQKSLEKEIAKIPVSTQIVRFDSLFCDIEDSKLKELREEFPFFMDSDLPDSVFISKKKHPSYQNVCNEISALKHEKIIAPLISILKHYKFYTNNEFDNVFFLINDFDYETRFLTFKQSITIGAEFYLGSSSPYYSEYPMYLSRTFNQNNFASYFANFLSKSTISDTETLKNPSFLNKIIHEGKIKYFEKILNPNTHDSIFWKVPQKKLEWAKDNESRIWKHFIDQKFLYSKDDDLEFRFIQVAPFSKFYSNFDQITPGQIGIWIGYQIVKSYMDRIDADSKNIIKELNKPIDDFKFLKLSNYKP